MGHGPWPHPACHCAQNFFFFHSLGVWSSAGDPLAPCLFILAEEVLILRLLQVQIKFGTLALALALATTYTQTIFSFFARATTQGLQGLDQILTRSHAISGHVFKFCKIQLLTSPMIKSKIVNALEVPFAANISKYLGVPLFLGSTKNSHFQPLLGFRDCFPQKIRSDYIMPRISRFLGPSDSGAQRSYFTRDESNPLMEPLRLIKMEKSESTN